MNSDKLWTKYGTVPNLIDAWFRRVASLKENERDAMSDATRTSGKKKV